MALSVRRPIFLRNLRSADSSDLDSYVEWAWRNVRGSNRWVVSGIGYDGTLRALEEFIEDVSEASSGIRQLTNRRLTFVFSGMGPQWSGMGRHLFQRLPDFRDAILTVDRAFAPWFGSVWKTLNEYPPDADLPTELAQPANFLIQASLVMLLARHEITPNAVLGHSAGEVASAYAAGVYGLHHAARLAVIRGRWQGTLAGRGGMLAVGLSESDAVELILGHPDVSMAAINQTSSVTLSGCQHDLSAIEDRLNKDGIFAKQLRVAVPYHSPVMNDIVEPMTRELDFLRPSEPQIPLYSTVSTRRVRSKE